MKVSASEAAYLVNRHERIVRGHIKRGDLPAVKERNAWRIDTSDLEAIPGWHVDRGRLAQLEERSARSVESLSARLASVERELRDVRARLHALETRGTSAPAGDDALHREPPESHPSAFLVQSGDFEDGTQAARFLARHGIPYNTCRNWWEKRSYPRTGRDALALALRRIAEAETLRREWLIRTWHRRFGPCADDPACPCHELLPATRARA